MNEISEHGDAELFSLLAYAPFDVAAGLSFWRVHEVEAEDSFLAVRFNVEAVAIIALVFHEAAVAEGLPFVGLSQGGRND
jgi:hypothetical protein